MGHAELSAQGNVSLAVRQFPHRNFLGWARILRAAELGFVSPRVAGYQGSMSRLFIAPMVLAALVDSQPASAQPMEGTSSAGRLDLVSRSRPMVIARAAAASSSSSSTSPR